MFPATSRMLSAALATLFLVTQTLLLASSSDFEKLLATPPKFDGKQVTLIGVAEIGGDEFFLYPDARARRLGRPAVFIARDPNGPTYQRYNNHWLKVSGIVSARAHGPLGTDPCEVRAENVGALPRPPIPDVNIYGVFRNDESDTITLKVSTPNGYSIFDVRPHSTTPPGVISRGSVEATTASGRTLAKAELLPRRSAEQYFDAVRRSYYYRVIDAKIELVTPSETTKWGVFWPPEVGKHRAR